MVGNDSMGPALQLIEAQFSYFFLKGRLSREFKLRGMLITKLNGHISVVRKATSHTSHMVGHTGSTRVLCLLM